MPDPDARARRRQQARALAASGLTQRQIAAQLGVPKSTIANDLHQRPSRAGQPSRTPGQHHFGRTPIAPSSGPRTLIDDAPCTCPSWPCDGPASTDWLTCNSSCLACT